MKVIKTSLTCISYCLVLLVLSSCGGTKSMVITDELPSNFPDHSLTQILNSMDAGADSLHSFTAKASISVRSPGESLSFSSDMSHRRSDSLYMTIKPALGIEAARALVTPDSFFVYDRIKKKLYYGDIDKAGEYLPGPMSDDDVFGSLLGLPDLNDRDWQVSADSAHYFLTDTVNFERYTIDPRIWRVTRFDKTNSANEVIEYMTYSDFDRLDGFILPRKMVYEHFEGEKAASIYYRSMDLNPSSLSMNFTASDSADPINVK